MTVRLAYLHPSSQPFGFSVTEDKWPIRGLKGLRRFKHDQCFCDNLIVFLRLRVLMNHRRFFRRHLDDKLHCQTVSDRERFFKEASQFIDWAPTKHSRLTKFSKFEGFCYQNVINIFRNSRNYLVICLIKFPNDTTTEHCKLSINIFYLLPSVISGNRQIDKVTSFLFVPMISESSCSLFSTVNEKSGIHSAKVPSRRSNRESRSCNNQNW